MFENIELDDAISANLKCIQDSANLPFLLFWLGSTAYTWYIAKQNNFGLIDGILAAAGFKKFPRTKLINFLNFLVVFVPMILLYISVQSNCN